MSTFRPEEWIFIGDLDICPHSDKQVKVCQEMQMPIKGAILCNDPEHKASPACTNVPSFPSFCNVESQICVSGLRTTKAQFDDLQRISDKRKSDGGNKKTSA